MKVAVAAIRDADYTQTSPKCEVEESDDLLVLKLPCKELENLLLLKPETVTRAAKKAAEARAAATGQPAQSPSTEEVEKQIEESTQAPDIRDAIESQWLFRWCQAKGGLSDSGQLKEAKREFEKRWGDLSWRRRCCPGKKVLVHLRRWLQSEPWKVSLSLNQLFTELEPDKELQSLFDELEKYVARATA